MQSQSNVPKHTHPISPLVLLKRGNPGNGSFFKIAGFFCLQTRETASELPAPV